MSGWYLLAAGAIGGAWWSLHRIARRSTEEPSRRRQVEDLRDSYRLRVPQPSLDDAERAMADRIIADATTRTARRLERRLP